jgi:hypothetical protein
MPLPAQGGDAEVYWRLVAAIGSRYMHVVKPMEVRSMRHLDVTLDDQDFAQAAKRAKEVGLSLEAWARDVLRQAAQPGRPTDPLFGILADEPELADAIDAVVAERGQRTFRA